MMYVKLQNYIQAPLPLDWYCEWHHDRGTTVNDLNDNLGVSSAYLRG